MRRRDQQNFAVAGVVYRGMGTTWLRIPALLLIAGLAAFDPSSPPRQLLIVPVGEVPAQTLLLLRADLTHTLRREVAIGAAIAVPPSAYDESRKQYLGSALLQELKTHDTSSAQRVLGVIDGDVYAPKLNFIFGQAQKPGRFAVVAMPRLRERGGAAEFRERLAKVAVHEIGHTFGASHCEERTCVMHFANSVLEIDHARRAYCGRE
jgi:archaemetzincin